MLLSKLGREQWSSYCLYILQSLRNEKNYKLLEQIHNITTKDDNKDQ